MHIKTEKLKQIILDSGIVDKKSWESAEEEAKRSYQTISETLIGREEISDDYLTELLQPYFDVPIINLKKVAISQEKLFLLPETFAKAKKLKNWASL